MTISVSLCSVSVLISLAVEFLESHAACIPESKMYPRLFLAQLPLVSYFGTELRAL